MKKWFLIIVVVIILGVAAYFYFRQPAVVPPKVTPTKVTVQAVTVHDIPEEVSAIGQLIAPNTIMIRSQAAGNIVGIYFKSGQWVKKGQLLVKLDDVAAKTALANKQATYRMDEAKYQRYKRLQKRSPGSISKEDVSEAYGAAEAAKADVASAKKVLQDTAIKAPFSGYVAALQSLSTSGYSFGQAVSLGSQIAIGSYLSISDPIVLLSNPDNMLAQYQVPQLYSAKLKMGQAVVVINNAYPDEKFKGSVSFISPIVDESSQAYQMRARINNNDRHLRSGMTVFVTQTLNPKHQVLVVPGLALVPTLTGYRVYTIVKGKVNGVSVTIGQRHDTLVEIKSGLKAGQKIIVGGVSKVHLGSNVQVVSQ